MNEQETFLELPLAQIGQNYGRFRLSQPASEAFVMESLRRYGQLLPVIVGRVSDEAYELVDGFKRFRACKQLGFKSLKARIFNATPHGLKACMIEVNWKGRSITELEEALVIESLYREDGLSQVEIAALLGRHKSWVCRRIALIERLCDEALSHLRLGLINATIGRELTRLPRGNQEAALAGILKYRLNCRETERLISLVLEKPGCNHEALLRFPQEILEDRSSPRPSQCTSSDSCLDEKLDVIEQCCQSILDLLRGGLWDAGEVERLSRVVDKVEETLNRVKQTLGRQSHL